MENKKPIIIAVIVLVIVTTLWMLVGKFQSIKGGKKSTPSVSSEPKNSGAPSEKKEGPTSFDILPATGTVENIDDNKLTLATESGEIAIAITPEHAIFLINEENQIATTETSITELQKGFKVKVRYMGPVTPENNYIASNADQGIVTAIEDGSLTIKFYSGEKTIQITPVTSIYSLEGEQAVDKKAADITIGSAVKIGFADEATKTTAVVVRIDKL